MRESRSKTGKKTTTRPRSLRPLKPKARSRLSNGSHLPKSVDGRSLYARRFRDLTIAHINDLGGIDAVSAAEQSIVRRAVTLEVALEQLEARFARSGNTTARDLELYGRAASTLRRLLEATGLKRRARDVTPSLDEYIRGAS